jgi:hypothetical protein
MFMMAKFSKRDEEVFSPAAKFLMLSLGGRAKTNLQLNIVCNSFIESNIGSVRYRIKIIYLKGIMSRDEYFCNVLKIRLLLSVHAS